ncbi:MAG: hypothetical protein ABIE25_04375 [Thermoplasmatota archaeon]|nr:hypothetical protein [Candidatus Thermoplasmatota archaeon]MBU1913967.1 hypothetical protein [Candidatus Thermoplasmatota archaeon]
MKAVKSEAVKISYQKRWFALGTATYVAMTAALFYLSESSVEDSIKIFWFAAGLAEGILFFLFIVPPLLTSHLAGDKGLRLHMGLLIDETIPYNWVREIKESSIHWGAVKVGIGVRYSGITRALFVTSSFNNLVVIKLDKEHMIGRVFRKPVSEIVVSVSFAKGFLDAMSQRAGLERGV